MNPNLRTLLHLQRDLMLRPLTPEVGIYRKWLRELIKEYKNAKTFTN